MTMTMTMSHVEQEAGWVLEQGGLIGPMSIGDAIGERAEGRRLTHLRGKISF